MKFAVALLSITNFVATSAFIPTPTAHQRVSLALAAEKKKAPELWKVERCDHVSDWITDSKLYKSPLAEKERIPKSWFIGLNDAVAAKVQVNAQETMEEECEVPEGLLDDSVDVEVEEECSPADRGLSSQAFILAGPRAEIAFEPKKCKAAIVTCGGLCPGLNSVVREIVMCLQRQYGVEEVFGIPEGYRGFLSPEIWRPLNIKNVKHLHSQGGSTLGTSRGGHDTKAIVDNLVEQGINLLFVSGGDGTLRGAAKIAEEVKARGLPMAVAMIPKTIDNDVPLLDRTFGFETAVEAAREAIDVANVEAEGFPYGLGVVKVMGRGSGFIAMHAALGCGLADLCLVPEVEFELDGPGGITEHLFERLMENNNALIVVAEGAGQKLMEEAGAAGDEVKDLSGNVLLDDVGPWLCNELKKRLDDRLKEASPNGDGLYLKYLDPSYMVRGVPPTTSDNLYCTQLAHNAVHGAMAGLTSFVVGSVNTRECYLPIEMIANKSNIIDVRHQSLWEYVVFATGQPAFQTENDPRDDMDVITSASGGVTLEN